MVIRKSYKRRRARLRRLRHRGLNPERLVWDDPTSMSHRLETAFADEWAEENVPRPSINHGMGMLQDLLVKVVPYPGGHTSPGFCSPDRAPVVQLWITKREAMIVATVIQWLGTNVGRSFLCAVFRRAGYTLTAHDADGRRCL